MHQPPDTLRIVFGYDGSDAARRGLARVRQLAAKQLAVLVVAVEPEIRSPGLGSDLTGRTIATGRLLEEARQLLSREEAVTGWPPTGYRSRPGSSRGPCITAATARRGRESPRS